MTEYFIYLFIFASLDRQLTLFIMLELKVFRDMV